MKKIIILLAVCLFFSVFAAYAAESELYARTIMIEKVYPHQLGYKLMYTTGKLDFVTTYLPHKWFSHSSTKDGKMAKGEVVWGNDPSYPYMIVFWKGGKFSHVRLFLNRNLYDLSYGVMNPQEDPAEKFNIEEISLEF